MNEGIAVGQQLGQCLALRKLPQQNNPAVEAAPMSSQIATSLWLATMDGNARSAFWTAAAKLRLWDFARAVGLPVSPSRENIKPVAAATKVAASRPQSQTLRERAILCVEVRGFAMPYCSQCSIEYVEGTTQCEDCGSALLPGSPPESPRLVELSGQKNVKLVVVRVFNGGTAQMEADLARNILQSQGIPCLLQGESSAEMLPVLDIPLLVREEDVAKAERILQEYLNAEVQAGPEEPDPAEGE